MPLQGAYRSRLHLKAFILSYEAKIFHQRPTTQEDDSFERYSAYEGSGTEISHPRAAISFCITGNFDDKAGMVLFACRRDWVGTIYRTQCSATTPGAAGTSSFFPIRPTKEAEHRSMLRPKSAGLFAPSLTTYSSLDFPLPRNFQ